MKKNLDKKMNTLFFLHRKNQRLVQKKTHHSWIKGSILVSVNSLETRNFLEGPPGLDEIFGGEAPSAEGASR